MGHFIQWDTSNGCVDASGFKAAGVHCDIRGKRDGRLDLALIVSDRPCSAAAVFTRNRMAAAPVHLDREVLAAGGKVRGIVANSGNANACTGLAGMEDARAMQAAAASATGLAAGEFFIASTGRIGKRLPMEGLLDGIRTAAAALDASPVAGQRAADAILTSDTRRKVCTVEVETSAGRVRIAGMAKGAGMIEPNMATMLAFICTDAEVARDDLQTLLSNAVHSSFNAVTVDGDESTNDTVVTLANGASGIQLAPGMEDWSAFASAFATVCQDLARKIVGDGEKITKVVEVCIQGAATEMDAEIAARAVANSLLVKSSWYGNDPNWGRIMDALGYSGAELYEQTIQLWYAAPEGEPVPVFLKGNLVQSNLDSWKAIVSARRFRVIADLGSGSAAARVWSTDLTPEYVNFNKSE